MTTIFARSTRVAVLTVAGLAFSFLPAVSVSAANPDASFEEDAYTSTHKSRLTLSGDAEDVRAVRVLIENEDGKRVFRSKEVRVKNDEWKIRVTKKLKEGDYTLSLLAPKSMDYEVLATSTLSVTDKKSTKSETKATGKGGAVYMSKLALLTGGTGTAGASVPVAYIKVGNASKTATTLEGFTLTQNGSASTAAVVGFSTNDDKGGSRATIDAKNLFKNGSVFVPLTAILAPGEVRIYTIKALLNGSLGSNSGKSLMLDVTGADTNGSVTTKFPIKGTTWNLR